MDWVNAFLLGLSSGVFCISTCLPVMAPVMGFRERKTAEHLRIFGQILMGRWGGYLLFGLFAGLAGERIGSASFDRLLNLPILMLSIILIYYSLGFLERPKTGFCMAGPAAWASKSPMLMGFLTGINICPPFLMSLGSVLSLHSLLKGALFFSLFFLGTTVYFIPLLGLGFMAKIREIQLAARVGGVIAGLLFLAGSIHRFLK
jgi:sulfite exporter TauE/SafE